MNAAAVLDQLIPIWRPLAVPEVGEAFFDRFVVKNRARIISLIEDNLRRKSARITDLASPADAWTPARRAQANLDAMQLLATKEIDAITNDDRRVLLGYSGWGGLSIEKHRDQFPAGWEPETFGLVHEYYTPTVIADAVAEALCPLLPGLVGRDGKLHALEPSAGIGRFILAINRACDAREVMIRWTAIELSRLSNAILPRLFPNVSVFTGSFEEWLHRRTSKDQPTDGIESVSRAQGTIRLVVANPPYGERGLHAKWDQAPEYAEREAFAYFLRRGLDLLAPYGIGVFVVPADFLTADSRKDLRERVLLRHHLMAAYRLPSDSFPGASLVTDLLFFRSRGGELAEIDEGDRFIVNGHYFHEYPRHILGEERVRDGIGKRFSYQVIGEFTGLPALVERPVCSACIVRPVAFPKAVASRLIERTRVDEDALSPLLIAAIALGDRVADYLAARAAGSRRALELWPELLASLHDFQRAPEAIEAQVTNPWTWMELRALAKREVPGAQHFLTAFDHDGDLIPALTTRPVVESSYRGAPDDLLGQVEYLYRSQRSLTLSAIVQFHRDEGGSIDATKIPERLFRSDWCLDGDEFVPLRDYVSGDLWPKYDALGVTNLPAEQARRQRERLLRAIQPVDFDDLGEVSPIDPYVPLRLVSEWLSDTLNDDLGEVVLERYGGLVQVYGSDYAALKKAPISSEVMWFLGWTNHDNSYFAPRDLHPDDPEQDNLLATVGAKDLTVWHYRGSYSRVWTARFGAWLREDPQRQDQVAEAYNRAHRGYVPRDYSAEDLELARWGDQIRLAPHQNSAARRVIEARGGLLALDVGVGKTYTGLAVLAAARQEGWGRRPVVLVPLSLIWKWKRDFQRCLPDYRVAVIGAKLHRLGQGERVKREAARLASGEITREEYEQRITVSRPETPEERAAKWKAFQAGLYDAVILSYEALKLTRVDLEAAVRVAEEVPAIRRTASLKERSAQGKKKASEREKAIDEASVQHFLADRLELSGNQRFDPGIAWEELGVDLLIVDESQNFKNLYAPEPREGGIPKYMGLPAGGSKRAWQLSTRIGFIHARTGGSGVVLLSATPAKNSPLEFYNLLHYIDRNAFARVGITNPEQFIDRYLKIEGRDVLNADFEIVRKSAVVGFHHLDELRAILDRYAEFRTAEEVGLKLPKPRVQRVEVAMDHAQEAKYTELVELMTERLQAMIEGKGDVDRGAILGDMVRLSLIALHADLDEGYGWTTAEEGGLATRKVPASALARWVDRGWDVLDTKGEGKSEVFVIQRDLPTPNPESPKFHAVAERIAAQPDCGHIVFCEPIACHRWLRTILIDYGIPAERIGIMNAAATDTAARTVMAQGFNGDPDAGIDPSYDVIIANSVAYEGVDLQVRTCAVHHLDLPWTPADLEQRNGRAYRQGNTLGTLEIIYYIAQGSMDAFRFGVIHGKRGWLAALLESQARDTNNPAAQEEFSPEELLEYLARDKGTVRRLLEQRRLQRAEEQRRRQSENSALLLRQAAGRFRRARHLEASEPERAARFRDEAEDRLRSLTLGAGDAWPWTDLIYAFREVDGLIPADGQAPVFEGMKIIRGDEALEFGRVLDTPEGEVIGMRRAGEAHWSLLTVHEIANLEIRPEHLKGGEWPIDDEATTDAAINLAIQRLTLWTALGWKGATESFRARWWGRYGPAIREQLARRSEEALPVRLDSALHLLKGPALRDGELLAPTLDGWRTFLELAPTASATWRRLREIADLWWGRKLPADLRRAPVAQDDESTLRMLQRRLAEASELIRPAEYIDWLSSNGFTRAATVIEAYLEDRGVLAISTFAKNLRDQLDRDLEAVMESDEALDHEGRPSLSSDHILEDRDRLYVLVRTPGEPARRVYVTPPSARGAPFTLDEGRLLPGDWVYHVVPRDAEQIEEAWAKYTSLLHSLDAIPVILSDAHELLGAAAAAIDTPLCIGRERRQAIAALRAAEKYYQRASERIALGRPLAVLEALAQMVRHLARSAHTAAESCRAGQRTIVESRLYIPEETKKTLEGLGEAIVDPEDTAAGSEVQEAPEE